MPVILKGIQSYKDAKMSASLGCHVWVSNHGARQLDTVRATIEMLEECVRGVREAKKEVLTLLMINIYNYYLYIYILVIVYI